jgi:sec-independent protein translocase protein TatC
MDDTPRPLTDHLEELRRRLFWILGTWALCAGIAGLWVRDVFALLLRPAVQVLQERGHTLIALAPPELFFAYVKSALLAGFIVSIPMTLYQIWSFVAPGLYNQERRFAAPFVISTTGLFFGGALFGYFLAFPYVFEYLASLESDVVKTTWSVQMAFAFISRLYLAFGIAFQLPVAIFFLSYAGIVSPDSLASGRKYAIVVMFVAGAILTPPDVVSQVMLAGPLILLYESGILIARLVGRRETASSEAVEPEA